MWAADSKGRSRDLRLCAVRGPPRRTRLRRDHDARHGAGFARFHGQFCTMDWADLLAPAIRMAQEGVVVTPFFRDFLARAPQPGLPTGMQRVTDTPACAALYLNGGRLHEVGERPPPRDGRDAGTPGRGTAPPISTRATSPRGSPTTSAATAPSSPRPTSPATACVEGAPVIGTYRGYSHRLQPAAGLGRGADRDAEHPGEFRLRRRAPGSVRHLDLVARAMAAAHEDREQWLGDPAFVDVPVETMISKARAADWARTDPRRLAAGRARGSPPVLHHASLGLGRGGELRVA